MDSKYEIPILSNSKPNYYMWAIVAVIIISIILIGYFLFRRTGSSSRNDLEARYRDELMRREEEARYYQMLNERNLNNKYGAQPTEEKEPNIDVNNSKVSETSAKAVVQQSGPGPRQDEGTGSVERETEDSETKG